MAFFPLPVLLPLFGELSERPPSEAVEPAGVAAKPPVVKPSPFPLDCGPVIVR